MQSLGSKIKEARKLANLKQSDIADSLGIKNTTVSNWEKDISKPDLDTIEYLCGLFNVSASYFIDDMASKEILSVSEKETIKKYRILNQNEKKAVDDLIDTLSNKYPKGYNADLKWFDDPTQARIFIEQAQGTMLPTMGERKHDISDDDACEIATNLFHKLNG